MVRLEHSHSLKGMNAFLYSYISEKTNPEKALDSYKACMCAFRLVLAIATMKSFSENDSEKIGSKLCIMKEAAFTAARHLYKQKDNPFVETMYEAAAGTLEQVTENSEKLLRKSLPADNSVKERKIAHNQEDLKRRALEKSQTLLAAVGKEPNLPRIEEKNSLDSLLNIGEAPLDPAKFFLWLKGVEEKLRDLSNAYPDMLLPVLNSLISQFELPSPDSVWLKMPDYERRQCLKVFSTFSEQLSKNAFQQHKRFSLEIQNSGARLLLIAHAIAESLDNKNILHGFRPDLKGFRKLTTSPYLQCMPYTAWQQRQEILDYMHVLDADLERKSAWKLSYKNGISFDRTPDGVLAEAILNAYPTVNAIVEKQLRNIRQRKDLDILRHLVPGQLLIAELLNIKIQGNINNTLDLNDENIQPLAYLTQVAMHINLLSDKRARQQSGYENVITFQDGLNFDLTYAKKQKIDLDFNVEGIDPKYKIDANQSNLKPQEKWIENQNETLRRFTRNEEEKSNELFSFEESASESSLAAIQLLNKLKTELSHFDDSKFRVSLERYLFKIIVANDGTESSPLLDEMSEYPHVFSEVLQSFLDAANILTKNSDPVIFNEKIECILALSIRLFEMAQAIPCLPVLDVLEKYHKQMQASLKVCLENLNESQDPQYSAKLKIFQLKFLELHASKKIDWMHYFKWGSKLQQQLEQKEVLLDPAVQIWWNNMRWKMAQRFRVLQQKNPHAAKVFIHDENFDVLEMSFGKGKWQSIPINVLKNSEFSRLFSDRIHSWKVDEDNKSITFSDPLTGKYRLTNCEKFPQTLQRLIDGIWHIYIPHHEAVNNLHIPTSIQQESIWWLNPDPNNLRAQGFYKCKPDKVWLEREKNGVIVFKDGVEKGMRLELVEGDDQSVSKIEVNTGAFGLHHYAYNPRFLGDHLIDFRDLLIFPNVRMQHGGQLVFERHGHEFYEQGNSDRKLGDCLFAPSSYYVDNHHTKHKSSPLKLYGIQIRKRNKDALKNEEETTLLVPFQRHVSDPHVHIVHALTQKISPDSPSLLNSVEVIEIKIDAHGFLPETSRENLFAAYLSLIGKDYHEALRFLRNIRPNHRLDTAERQILKWFIDSKEDAQDHSPLAASIKLFAYKILVEQGMPLKGEISPTELPNGSLEAIYLDYLNHISSVPQSLTLGPAMEDWILEFGFACFPSSKDNQKQWNSRREELTTGRKTIETFILPKPAQKSLFEKWKEPTISKQCTDIEIPSALTEGITNPGEQALMPGKPYPVGSFGYHYNKLYSNEITEQEKWEFIYALETVEMSEFIKIALQTAFHKGKESVALPMLNKKSRYENSRLVQECLRN